MSTGTQTIEIEGEGPILHELKIHLPPEGGVTVLHGENGTGKSMALSGVSRVLGGNQPLEKSDGVARGRVEGLGVKIGLTKVCRVTGQCVAVSLEGKLDVGAFIDPGIADPEAADRKRIKALLAIRGVGPDGDRFRDLDNDSGVIDDILSETSLSDAPDLVEQSRRMKSRLDGEAWRHEDNAATLDGKAAACREVAEGVDLDGETDRDKLLAELEVALNTSSALHQQQVVCTAAEKARKAAQVALDDAKASYTGPTYADARQETDAIHEARDNADDEVDRLREQLEAAITVADQAENAWVTAGKAADAAQHHENLIIGWQATIDADHPEPVGAADYAAAELAVREARAAIERGALIRDAVTKADEARSHAEEAAEAREEAKRLRKAAKATDDVLSAAVASDTIRVENGRLVVPHGKRGKCLVGDLSRGECARLGILEAVAAIRAMHAEGVAVIVVPQHIWEGLDPAARQLVCEVAREEKVNIVTAMADNGPLRVETEKEESP